MGHKLKRINFNVTIMFTLLHSLSVHKKIIQSSLLKGDSIINTHENIYTWEKTGEIKHCRMAGIYLAEN